MTSSPTRFDPMVQALTRRAESIYTKMGIKRDESEDLARKKKGDRENEAKSIPWEDTTEVSLPALRGFLEDLVGASPTMGNGETIAPHTTQHNGAPSAQNAPPPNPAAARAAHAYQTTGHVVHDRNVETTTPHTAPHSESTVQLGSDFGEEEKLAIRDYIRRLLQLELKGVETLTLRRSLTFLESINLALAEHE